MVRGGQDGEVESRALKEGLAIIGWSGLGDLGAYATKDQLRAAVAGAYPESPPGNVTSQLWGFTREMESGDLVVMPLKTEPGKIAIGRVIGHYEYRSGEGDEFPHVRAVQWFPERRLRGALKSDLRASIGSLLTVSRLRRHEAPSRIAHFAETGVDAGIEGEPEITDAGQLLEEAVRRAEVNPNNPMSLTIRNLLAHWGVWRRTAAAIEMISGELADVGLTTRPYFTEGSVDTEVALVPLENESDESDASVADGEAISEAAAKETSGKLRLGSLPSKLVLVPPGTTLTAVRTLMLRKGFSQLAVIDDDGTLHGAVTWESIGKAYIASDDPTLADAMTPANVVDHDANVLDLIEYIRRDGFVLVRSSDRKSVTGIVTAADLTGQFGQHAKPFLLIENAEGRLRRAAEVFSAQDLRAAVPKHQQAKVHSPNDLTFGNYRYLLEDPARWQTLGWKIDHSTLLSLLEKVGQVRNALMHFSLDALSKEQYEAINELLILLDAVAPER
ncbi:CBS domain-containing protein [Microbispora sp. H10830]|uniref:CBS domain-containing protein n=1 Tax=Microbispora sp. H10830 TaxID=2729109 RepID=UPI00160083F7|nr:CBS domain-containing protein [Microbispora sp. H10830]